MKKGIGPRALGSPLKQTKSVDKGFYVTGEKTKGEMGSGFYISGDGKRSHTPNSGGINNVDPGFNIGAKKKAVKKVVKRKIEKPITAAKPKPIPRIVK